MKLKKWFTLIELMITITVIWIISLAAYAPYWYYEKKAKLRNTASLITQVLYEARNKAINWVVWINGNVSIWVLFDSHNKNEINIFSYPYNIDYTHISYSETSEVKKIKTVYLDEWIQIDSIEWGDDLLFFFNSIDWKIKYFKKWPTWLIVHVTWSTYDDIWINFSYMWSNSINLKKSISYFTSTNIIDY